MLKTNQKLYNIHNILLLITFLIAILNLFLNLGNPIDLEQIHNSLLRRTHNQNIDWQFIIHNNYFLPKLISVSFINLFSKSASIIFVTLNLFAILFTCYKLDKTFKQKQFIKYLIILISSYIFLENIYQANFIIIEILLFTIFIDSKTAIKSASILLILCLFNPLFSIMLFPLVTHRRYKSSLIFIIMILFGFLALKQNIISAFDINNSFFTIRNNISITSFAGFIGSLSSKDNILYARDIGIIFYFSILLSFITIEIIKYRKYKYIDQKETKFDYMLFLPFIAGYPQYQPTENLLYLIAMLPILKYAYDSKIACKSCVIGFFIFTILAITNWQIIDNHINQKFIKIIPSFTLMMFTIWVTAINIRKAFYIKYRQ